VTTSTNDTVKRRIVVNDPLRNVIDWNEDCLRWRGSVLTGKYAHWCMDWDGLPVDETTSEWDSCTCYVDEKKQVHT
jgi:hypothetical protein